jgi:hypothetical protein
VKKETGEKFASIHFPIGQIEAREPIAVLSQVRLIEARRLVKKIAALGRAVI